MTSFKLDIHGKQTLLPKLLSLFSVLGWICIGMLVLDQKTTFELPYSIKPLLIISFFAGFITTIIRIFIGSFETKLLWKVIGEIELNEKIISLNNIDYPIDSINKIYFKAYNTKGVAQGKGVISDGAGNEIEITINSLVEKRKFIIENNHKRELLKDFCKKLKEKNVSVYIDGIDLK